VVNRFFTIAIYLRVTSWGAKDMITLIALASAGAMAGQTLPWLDRRWMDQAARREALVAASASSFDAPPLPHLRLLLPRAVQAAPRQSDAGGPAGL
jgi:hypothetical protein